jgi:putative membrane protein
MRTAPEISPVRVKLRSGIGVVSCLVTAKKPLSPAPIHEEKRATEYLANERTFLAWIRTSIAVISLGFVVAKFSVWLRELALRLDPHAPATENGASLPIGLAMMALGGILALLAAWRYHRVNLAIERGEVKADRGLVILVTLMIAALAVVMIIYMLVTDGKP